MSALQACLCLQSARYLLKNLLGSQTGRAPQGSASYLGNAKAEMKSKCEVSKAKQWREPDVQLAALRYCPVPRPTSIVPRATSIVPRPTSIVTRPQAFCSIQGVHTAFHIACFVALGEDVVFCNDGMIASQQWQVAACGAWYPALLL